MPIHNGKKWTLKDVVTLLTSITLFLGIGATLGWKMTSPGQAAAIEVKKDHASDMKLVSQNFDTVKKDIQENASEVDKLGSEQTILSNRLARIESDIESIKTNQQRTLDAIERLAEKR